MPSSFESRYPAITRWAKEFGRIEIGSDDFVDNFVKAIDKGGMPWGGKTAYRTIDEAFEDMERGIKAFLKEQGLDQEPTPDQLPSGRVVKPARKATNRSVQSGQKAAVKSLENRDRPKDQPFVKRVRKLGQIAEELRQGGHFSITRLTTIKGLCEDPKAAEAFALFLTRKIQRRMREKEAPERYRRLVNQAVREMVTCLNDPTEGRRDRLRSLLREIEGEQNEYENISWGMVRNVKSFDLIVVEHALKAVLRPEEATYWLYDAARDYTGRTDELIPDSAPMVEEIAGFWRKHYGLKR